MAYDNNMSGILARNERKQTDRHPDFSGQCEIDGRQYWISGWVKEGKPGSKMDGRKYFSLAFKAKDGAPAASGAGSQAAPAAARPSRSAAPPAAPATPAVEEDEIPF